MLQKNLILVILPQDIAFETFVRQEFHCGA